MMETPQCHLRACKNYQGVRWTGEDETTEIVYCLAFPNGIPDDIAYGDNKHLKPVEGDNGIQFEKEEKEVVA